VTSKRLRLSGADAIDARSAEPRRDHEVHIDSERIVWAGPRAEAPPFSDARTIDLRGRYLLPGLGDAHAHLMFLSPVLPGPHNVAAHMAHCLKAAQAALAGGFTTLRLVAEGARVDVALRDLFNGGSVVGPRLFVAGEALSPSGGHAVDREDYWGIRKCDGEEGWRKAARDQIQAGADQIKAIVTGGVIGHPQDVVDATTVAPGELEAAAQVAHSRGRALVVHASSSGGARLAMQLGARSIEHGYFLDDDALRQLVDTRTFLTPTLSITHQVPSQLTDDYERAAFTARGRQAWGVKRAEESLQRHEETFRRAMKAGVKIIAGSDYAPYPNAGHCELGFMVRAGMSPWQAIVAATQSIADALGVGDKLGTIEAGKWADLIAVVGDPLKDIRNLRQPVLVMRGGAVALEHLAAA
jgi:imidazolonepropionase-like amidohydrolase